MPSCHEIQTLETNNDQMLADIEANDPTKTVRLLHLAVHELLHGLDWAGGPVAQTTDSLGRPALQGTKVVEYARTFYNCPSLTSVPLHTDGSHWHWIPHGAVSEIIGPSGGSGVGPFTMAALEDTSWYEGNWDNVVRSQLI